LPRIDEEIVEKIDAFILTESSAVHLRATQQFVDIYGIERRVGDMWLISLKDASTHMRDVHEQFLRKVNLTVLSSTQYVYVTNPCDDQGVPQRGRKIAIKGPKTFFARPGETVGSIANAELLGPSLALVVRANESFIDEDGINRKAGYQWTVFGPKSYMKPVEVTIVKRMHCLFGIPALNLYVFPTPTVILICLLLVIYFFYWLFSGRGGNVDADAVLDESLKNATETLVESVTKTEQTEL